MSLFNVYSRMTSTPWLITSEALETIVSIAQRENESPQAVAARMGRELENTHSVELRDGTAVIPVNGPLFRYANLFTMISGATSYQMLATDLQEALDNPAVTSIMLNIDSPGGDANGVSEFANLIYQARGKKPITAYVGGMGASAAYWIASAADEIVVDSMAMVGSIGTVFTLEKREPMQGVQRFEIVSRQSPNKRLDIGTEAGRNQIQKWADEMGDIFVSSVARNRGVSVEKVLADFGQGDMLIGQKAVDAGMADRVGSFEGVIAELNNSQPSINRLPFAAGVVLSTSVEAIMPEENKPAAQQQQAAITLEYLQQNHSALVTEIQTTAASAAATTERTRVMAILDCEAAATRPALAKKLANMGNMSAEQAADLLASSAAEKPAGTGFAAMDAALSGDNPAVESDTGKVEATEGDLVKQTVALAKQFGIE
ncbi:head maturation protease [Pararheinheimera phage vB_PsoM_KLER1-1]|nr:head maturation protease [Pararheinheimera phage vB_PsoM_KLER1-1]